MINDSVLNIEDMIYEIRGKQVMLDSEVVVIKLHDYHYNMILINQYQCVNVFYKKGVRL